MWTVYATVGKGKRSTHLLIFAPQGSEHYVGWRSCCVAPSHGTIRNIQGNKRRARPRDLFEANPRCTWEYASDNTREEERPNWQE